MIELLKDFPGNVVALAASGQVTKADYEKVVIPAVERALAQHDKVRLYYQIGPDFSGIDPGAMWADTKIGMGHFLRWDRIAVITDVEWIASVGDRLRLPDAGAGQRLLDGRGRRGEEMDQHRVSRRQHT